MCVGRACVRSGRKARTGVAEVRVADVDRRHRLLLWVGAGAGSAHRLAGPLMVPLMEFRWVVRVLVRMHHRSGEQRAQKENTPPTANRPREEIVETGKPFSASKRNIGYVRCNSSTATGSKRPCSPFLLWSSSCRPLHISALALSPVQREGALMTTVIAHGTPRVPAKVVSVSNYNRYVQAEKNLHDAASVREETARLKQERQHQMAQIALAQRQKRQDVRNSTHVAAQALKVHHGSQMIEGAKARQTVGELRHVASRQREAWVAHGAKRAYEYNVVQAQRVFSSRVEHFAQRRAEAAAAKLAREQREAEARAEASAALFDRQGRFDKTKRWERSRPIEKSQEWCTNLKREAAEKVQQQTKALNSARRRSNSALLDRANAHRTDAHAARRNAQTNREGLVNAKRQQASALKATLKALEEARQRDVTAWASHTKSEYHQAERSKWVQPTLADELSRSEYGRFLVQGGSNALTTVQRRLAIVDAAFGPAVGGGGGGGAVTGGERPTSSPSGGLLDGKASSGSSARHNSKTRSQRAEEKAAAEEVVAAAEAELARQQQEAADAAAAAAAAAAGDAEGALAPAVPEAAPESPEIKRIRRLSMSSVELHEMADEYEKTAAAKEAIVGTLNNLSVELGGVLMDKVEKGTKGQQDFFRELDANGDGSVTKIEFRQMLRKLGLVGEGAKYDVTQGDKLFDDLDEDKGGDLDLKEIVNAIKKLKARTLSVAKREKKAKEDADDWRRRAKEMRDAAQLVEEKENIVTTLVDLRSNPSPEIRLATLLAKKQLKPADLLSKMDTDRGGSIDVREFTSGLQALGLDATQDELEEIFKDLDADNSKSLEIEEIKTLVTQIHGVKIKAQDQEKRLKKDMKAFEERAAAVQRDIRNRLIAEQEEKERAEEKIRADAEAKKVAAAKAKEEAAAKAEAKEREAMRKKEEFERRIQEKRKK